jgi:4-oxalocrotonate tautomerase
MPHINVKLYPGRTEEQKAELARRIVEDVVAAAGVGEDAVSVAIEEVTTEDWADAVYRKDIEPHLERPDRLYKKPGYRM